MLAIDVPESEWFDEVAQEFINVPQTTLRLEHSLLSISKWESKWHKPFLSIGDLQARNEVTPDMILDYINCMSLDGPIPRDVLISLDKNAVDTINQYIADPMTATWFKKSNETGGKEIITSELIYYWMFSLTIPIECENWHLNRLLTLIRVFNEKNKTQPKMTKHQIMQRNTALNAARRKALKTKG